MKKIFDTGINVNGLHFWLLLLRIAVAAFMLTHGYPKFTNLVEGNIQFGDPIGLGVTTSLVLVVFAEFFCSILVMLGLATRLAVIPLIINMSVAAFVAHAGDPFAKKEMSLMYLLIYITLLFTGPGRFSVDAMIGGNKRR